MKVSMRCASFLSTIVLFFPLAGLGDSVEGVPTTDSASYTVWHAPGSVDTALS
jgi:hypothetical protein